MSTKTRSTAARPRTMEQLRDRRDENKTVTLPESEVVATLKREKKLTAVEVHLPRVR